MKIYLAGYGHAIEETPFVEDLEKDWNCLLSYYYLSPENIDANLASRFNYIALKKGGDPMPIKPISSKTKIPQKKRKNNMAKVGASKTALRLLKEACDESKGVIDPELTKIEIKITELLINIKVNVYRIGELLDKAKKRVPHGKYMRWIDQAFGGELPYSTAHLYHSIYIRFKHKEKMVREIPLGILQLLKKEMYPEEIDDFVWQHADKFKEIDRDEFFDTCNNYADGKIDFTEFKKLSWQIMKLGEVMEAKEFKIRNTRRSQKVLRLGISDLRTAVKEIREIIIKVQYHFPAIEGLNKREDYKRHTGNKILEVEIDGAIEELVKLKESLTAVSNL